MVQSRANGPNTPTADLAAAIAARLVGCAPVSVVRFTTGAALCLRCRLRGSAADRGARRRTHGPVGIGGRPIALGALRPLGVPLPAILGDDIHAEFPWMAMERLPGQDLGAVIADLSDMQLVRIAAEVARAQALVAQTQSAGRYGYASLSQRAPHGAWRLVLEDSLSRSRVRIEAAGLFDAASVDVVRAKLATLRDEIDRIAATPFLHDTTTRNVIVAAAGAFSGIVDVDDLCFGDARYPIALTSAVLTAYYGERDDYVRAWMRHAGLRDDRLFQLYVALFLLDLTGEHGHVFNGNDSPSTPAARAALLRAFSARLTAIS
jgi:Phosphotransferase enzyme family